MLLNLADNPTSKHRRNSVNPVEKYVVNEKKVDWKKILLDGEDLGRRYYDLSSVSVTCISFTYKI